MPPSAPAARSRWFPNPSSLRLKIALYLGAALMTALLAFAALVLRQEREHRLRSAAEHVAQLSDVITRSTRFAMLQARPDYVHSIIEDVARQENIDRVRIFNKEGTIIDSTHAAEIGLKVDRTAEGCVQCHSSARASSRPPTAGACSRAWR